MHTTNHPPTQPLESSTSFKPPSSPLLIHLPFPNNHKNKKVMTEVEILRLAGEHRNIIGFRDLFQDDENWYIVMEMAEGGELFDRLVERGYVQ